eukprot:gene25823-26436_t
MFFSLLLATVSSGSSVGDVCSAAPLLCSGSQGSLQPDNYTTSTAAACCTLCSNKPDECFGWVWRKKTPESENGACHLKPPGVVQPCTGGDCTTPCGMLPPPPPTPHPKGAKNVLFILANTGILFSQAHVQFSYCAPSRNSFMSGRRPDANKCYNFNNHFREADTGQDWVALPQHFK